MIKIGDFGATKEEGQLWKTANLPGVTPLMGVLTRTANWNQRHAGKPGYSLPVIRNRL